MNNLDSMKTLHQGIMGVLFNSLDEYLCSRGIEEPAQRALLSSSYRVNLETGDIFIPEFDNAAICLVNSGLMRSNVEFSGDEIRICSFMSQGMTFTGSAPGMPAAISLYCLEDTNLTVIPGDSVYAEALKCRSVFDLMLQVYYSEKISHRDWVMLNNIVGKRDHMLYALILMSIANDIFNWPKMTVRYQDLADMSGTSRTYAVGVVQEAIAAGALEKSYRGIKVKDIDALANMVDLEPLVDFVSSVQ